MTLTKPLGIESKEMDHSKTMSDEEVATYQVPSLDTEGKASRATIEDYIFFANAQRIAKRNQDGKQYVDPIHTEYGDTNSTSKFGLADRLQTFTFSNKFNAESIVAQSDDLQVIGLAPHKFEKVEAWRTLWQASWIVAFYL